MELGLSLAFMSLRLTISFRQLFSLVASVLLAVGLPAGAQPLSITVPSQVEHFYRPLPNPTGGDLIIGSERDQFLPRGERVYFGTTSDLGYWEPAGGTFTFFGPIRLGAPFIFDSKDRLIARAVEQSQ